MEISDIRQKNIFSDTNSKAKNENTNIQSKEKDNIQVISDKSIVSNLNISDKISAQLGLDSVLIDSLKLAGIQVTSDNVEVIKALIDNGFSITKDNISKLNQAFKLMDNNMDKGLFLVKNEMPLTQSTAASLNKFASKEVNITNSISKLFDSILQLEEGPVKTELLKVLQNQTNQNNNTSSQSDNNSAQNKISSQTLVPNNIDNSTPLNLNNKVVNDFISNLIDNNNDNNSKVNPDNNIIKSMIENLDVSESDKNAFIEKFSALKEVALKIDNGTELQKSDILSKLSSLIKDNNLTDESLNNVLKSSLNLKIDITLLEKDEKLLLLSKFFSETELDELSLSNTKNGSINKSILEVEQLKSKFLDKFSVDFYKKDSKEINASLNDLKKTLDDLELVLTKNNLQQSKLSDEIIDTNKNLNFLNELKTSIHVQFPININGSETNCELFVFQKGKNKNKSSNESSSALLSLDLLSLGHLETYILKKGNDINCQFSLENDEVEKIIKSNIPKLNSLLNSVNLHLTSCQYKKNEEPFQLLEKEPILDDFDIQLENNLRFSSFDFKT